MSIPQVFIGMGRANAAFNIDLNKYAPKKKPKRISAVKAFDLCNYQLEKHKDFGLWVVTGPSIKITNDAGRPAAMVPVRCLGFGDTECKTVTTILHARLVRGGSKACVKCAGKYRKQLLAEQGGAA